MTFSPIIDLLKRYAHVDDHDDPRTIRAKVTGHALTLDDALQEILPALLSLLEALPREFTFQHALTHEVAYTSLLLARRRALHGRILDAIERHHPDRLSEQVERLAHHALWGGVWEKTVT